MQKSVIKKSLKDIQPKEFCKFIITKKHIRRFERLNTKTSEEDRYVKNKLLFRRYS